MQLLVMLVHRLLYTMNFGSVSSVNTLPEPGARMTSDVILLNLLCHSRIQALLVPDKPLKELPGCTMISKLINELQAVFELQP